MIVKSNKKKAAAYEFQYAKDRDSILSLKQLTATGHWEMMMSLTLESNEQHTILLKNFSVCT